MQSSPHARSSPKVLMCSRALSICLLTGSMADVYVAQVILSSLDILMVGCIHASRSRGAGEPAGGEAH